VAGLLVEHFGLYIPFAGYAAMLVAAVLALAFVRGPARPRSIGEKADHVPVRQMVATLVRSRTMIGLALAFAVLWTASMGRSQFETLYMNQLGAQAGIIGVAGTVSALFEVPFMLLGDRLVRRYGPGRILRIAMLVQAAAFLPVVLVPSIPSFFVLRILASIALALNSPSYFGYLVSSAPEGQGGTVVSLFDVTLRSGVSLLAAPLAGFLFDLLGAYWLYPIGLGGCLLAWLILQVTARPRPAPTV
jgi:MFS family permease